MTPTINDIKKDLEKRDKKELLEYCLRLAKYKKENKELLGFILFESDDIPQFIENIKTDTEQSFGEINMTNVYFIKKSVRKILRTINKYIKFAASKNTEAELLIHFCNCMHRFSIPMARSRQLQNIYDAQVKKITVAIDTLHPDLQYDLKMQIKY